MLKKIPGNYRYIAYAILIHIAFVAIIVFSLDWMPKPHRTQPPQNVVQAVTVDEKKLQAELEKRQAEERRKQQEKEEKALEAKRAHEEEERRQAELKKRREDEQRQLKEQQARQEVEAKKAKELEQKKKVETERLEKRKKEQEVLEKKQKEEEARLVEQRRKQEEERALQEQLAAEQRQLEAEREKKVQSIVDRYIEIIKQKVTRNWFRPAGAKENLSCTVTVRLIPGGEVLDVRITKSSGDPLFDRSVETAVLKASPLPLPPDPSLFERFRILQFVFKPEG